VTVTRFLIALNVLGFLWELYAGGPGVLGGFTTQRSQNVLLEGALYPAAVLQGGQWWRIFTGAFLHGGLLHIGVNMLSLWSVGRFIEFALGPWRMLFVYVVSLVASGLGVVYLSNPTTPTLGASGAIFGLFGAWFVVSRRLQLDSRGILVLIGINLAFSFIYRSTIAWQDHIGGLIVGMVVTAAFAYAPRKNRVLVQAAAAVAVLVILIVIVVLRTNHLTAEYGQAAGL